MRVRLSHAASRVVRRACGSVTQARVICMTLNGMRGNGGACPAFHREPRDSIETREERVTIQRPAAYAARGARHSTQYPGRRPRKDAIPAGHKHHAPPSARLGAAGGSTHVGARSSHAIRGAGRGRRTCAQVEVAKQTNSTRDGRPRHAPGALVDEASRRRSSEERGVATPTAQSNDAQSTSSPWVCTPFMNSIRRTYSARGPRRSRETTIER